MSDTNTTETGADTIRRLLRDTMEPTIPPDTILAQAMMHKGKPLTKRHVDAMNASAPGYGFRIDKIAGMTSIVWGDWARSNGTGPGGSVLIAYQIAGAILDPVWVREHNAAYYDARDTRNNQRRALLADDDEAMHLGRLVDSAREAAQAFRVAYSLIKQATAYGQPLGVIHYDVERAIGLGTKHDADPCDRLLKANG